MKVVEPWRVDREERVESMIVERSGKGGGGEDGDDMGRGLFSLVRPICYEY